MNAMPVEDPRGHQEEGPENARRRGALSVVICTRNRPLELHRTLVSLSRQRMPPHEIIVVDASDNGKEYRPEPGVGAAASWHAFADAPSLTAQRNFGLDRAAGEFILFLDDDVVLEDDYTLKILQPFREAAVVGASGYITNDIAGPIGWLRNAFVSVFWGNTRTRVRPGIGPTLVTRATSHVETHRLTGCNMVFRATVIREVRFDENLTGFTIADDVDASIRASQHGTLLLVPGARLVHLKSKRNRYNRNRSLCLMKADWEYLTAKHFEANLRTRLFATLGDLGLILQYLAEILLLRAEFEFQTVHYLLWGASANANRDRRS